jgi:segregation and condensation protein A
MLEEDINKDQKIQLLKQASDNLQSISLSAALEVAGGIEFIVQLAEKGEIDPKDVDIIYVTDKFLQAIAAAPKENLRQSGKVIFHASVLLRMKAEALLSYKMPVSDDYLEFDEDGGELIYDSDKNLIARQITLVDLEKALIRRVANKANRPRKVTLDELIAALREAERIEKMRIERAPKIRIQMDGMHDINDVDDILDLAHDEDIEVTIDKVERILINHFLPGQSLGLLDLVIRLGQKSDWVDAFLAVLFLANTGKITLEQDTFYGPLSIMRMDDIKEANNLAKQMEAS